VKFLDGAAKTGFGAYRCRFMNFNKSFNSGYNNNRNNNDLFFLDRVENTNRHTLSPQGALRRISIGDLIKTGTDMAKSYVDKPFPLSSENK
jgi:hypothetical protein